MKHLRNFGDRNALEGDEPLRRKLEEVGEDGFRNGHFSTINGAVNGRIDHLSVSVELADSALEYGRGTS